MADRPRSLAELIERMDRIHHDARDLIAESRRLRAANRRSLAATNNNRPPQATAPQEENSPSILAT
jgi:hypothetical protein